MKNSKRTAKMIRTILMAIVAPAIILALFGQTGCAKKTDDKKDEPVKTDEPSGEQEISNSPVCEIVVKNYGTITVTLNREQAPITVDHFVKLAKDGSYDGAYINRVQAGFVLQGGAGAKDNSTIKGEFSSNGVDNLLKHKKGVISMARATDPNSASSQFFIMLEDNSDLDGNYAAFGEVTAGWDTVEKICAAVKSSDFLQDYYGLMMGFLKETSYFTIETVRVVSE